ncbi:MAG: tRNA (adenosine(37)-N6)-dimethylallyltransferase MiaA [Magnetococcales bacterium]|nr:tRNA (adenosine(37)-N6)-dimethylallyltransferase MiaA [Magnetococcales bacterium]
MNGTRPSGPVIFVMGPTASGKSSLGLALAEKYPLEIVNADSVQVYRDFNIGAAKPTPEEQQRIRHHLLDQIALPEIYSADQYRQEAWKVIDHCHARGVIPLFVGGSGLYFRAVERGLAAMPPIDPTLREAIRQEGETLGWAKLHTRLRHYDPELARRIPENDSQRIRHALAVVLSTGMPLSQWQQQQPPPPALTILKLVLQWPRDWLYRRIESRFEQMLGLGLLEEAKQIWSGGHDRQHPAMKSVGYRQLFTFFDGSRSLEGAVAWAKQESRRYAKRQMTWFRDELKSSAVSWNDMTLAFEKVDDFVRHHGMESRRL